MRFRLIFTLMLAFLGGCGGNAGQTFSVHFGTYVSDIGPNQQAVVMNAASYAVANPIMPVSIQGYQMRPETSWVDTVEELRVANVKAALIAAGVSSFRIQVLGNGVLYPEGVPMPELPDGVVDIRIGL